MKNIIGLLLRCVNLYSNIKIMQIYIDNRLNKMTDLENIILKLNKKYNNTSITYYDSFKDIFPFPNLIENKKINLDIYKENININRYKYLFLKKGNNVIVEDTNKKFHSMTVYKNRGYRVFNIKLGQNCTLNCKYCYLLGSNKFNPEIAIYLNIKEEVLKFLNKHKDEKIMFNLGEHTDTMLYDDITEYNKFFREILDEYPNLIVESRTKILPNSIKTTPHERFIWAFSLSVNNRDNFGKKEIILNKIKRISEYSRQGYKIALKFDPIIDNLEEYDEDFFNLIEGMNIDNIDHYSLGTLRFSPSLMNIIENVYGMSFDKNLFELANGKYVVKNKEKIYNFFKDKLNFLNKEFYISMEPMK